MSLITAENLCLGYESHVIAGDLNFRVDPGDYLCIVGENGSGKSTLMRTLLGLQKPISGSITTGDGLKMSEIGYLPQQTDVQRDFPASVREIVMSGFQGKCGMRPFYTAEEKKIAEECMKKMSVDTMAGRCYRELSGGQQQRVLLARALCAAGRILLLDEPVTGLDPKVTADMYELISSLNHEGTAIIMISHDIGAAVRYASHILHIGDTIFFGTREDYLRSEAGKLFASGISAVPEDEEDSSGGRMADTDTPEAAYGAEDQNMKEGAKDAR